MLDEPTSGLHPSDVERLLAQLNALVEAGNTVIVVDHDMALAAAGDWVIDIAREREMKVAGSSQAERRSTLPW